MTYNGGSASQLRRWHVLGTALVVLATTAVTLVPGKVGVAAPVGALAGSVLVDESFRGATADPRFEAYGSACLTGAPAGAAPAPGAHPLGGCGAIRVGPVPPAGGAGNGYLQLTDAANDQSGAVLYTQPIPAAQGLRVSFEQWQYGSTTPATPADGISFFLVDGAGTLNAPGAFGGSLGYAQKLPDDNLANPFLPGVNNGYLGIGLDVLGNYFGDWEHRGDGCAQRSPAGTIFRVPAPGPNMVTVRGPGDGTQGYCFLTATTSNLTSVGPWPSTLPGQLQGPLTTLPPNVTPQEAETLLEPSRRTVVVELSPAPNPQVTVDVDFNNGNGPQRVLSFAAPQPVPTTYKFGFAGSTGLFTDVHLIRTVQVNSQVTLPTLNLVKQVALDPPLPPVLTVGTPVHYQFLVTNTGSETVTELSVSDPAFPQVFCPTVTLAPGGSTVCTATWVVTAADVARGYLQNTATASGTTPTGPVTSPPSEVTVPIGATIGLALTKEADGSGPFRPGDTVAYTYTVTNLTEAVVTDLQILDDRLTGVTCDQTTLQPAGTAGDSTTCHGTYTVTSADADAGCLINTAIAIGDNGQVVSQPATATVPVHHDEPKPPRK